MAELGAKHDVHPAMIAAWKKQAVEGLAGVCSGKAEAADAIREGEVEKLRAKIGSWWWSEIFVESLRSMSLDSEATHDRHQASAAFNPAAMPAGFDQPLGLSTTSRRPRRR